MKRFSQKSNVIRHVMFVFGWNVGKRFTIEGVYKKLNGLGMSDDNYSRKRYFRVSRSTVRRAIESMLECGEIKVVEKKYSCYDRVLYELITVYPF